MSQDYYYVRLLQLGPFDKRARGGWRFGTKVIAETVVERLIANGLAKNDRGQICQVVNDDTKGQARGK